MNAEPVASAVVKAKVPFADTDRLLPPLSSRVTDSPIGRPITVPPTVKFAGGGADELTVKVVVPTEGKSCGVPRKTAVIGNVPAGRC